MDLTVIISYYKELSNLTLILKALNNQSCTNFEVLVSEDDCIKETAEFLKIRAQDCRFPIAHIMQSEDKGFRKNMMLNKALLKSNAKTVVFIDGDCIPHRHFVKEYIKHSRENYICFGRRVKLGEEKTSTFRKNHDFKKLNIFSLLFSDTKKVKDSIYWPWFPLAILKKRRGIVGCNWGVLKKHLIEINGFDQDYVMPGVGEDTDIEWRLKANGLKMKSMKNKAIVYHMYHPRSRNSEIDLLNLKLLENKKSKNKISCLNGLKKIKLS